MMPTTGELTGMPSRQPTRPQPPGGGNILPPLIEEDDDDRTPYEIYVTGFLLAVVVIIAILLALALIDESNDADMAQSALTTLQEEHVERSTQVFEEGVMAANQAATERAEAVSRTRNDVSFQLGASFAATATQLANEHADALATQAAEAEAAQNEAVANAQNAAATAQAEALANAAAEAEATLTAAEAEAEAAQAELEAAAAASEANLQATLDTLQMQNNNASATVKAQSDIIATLEAEIDAADAAGDQG